MNLVFSTKNTNKKPSFILTEKNKNQEIIKKENPLPTYLSSPPLIERNFKPKEIIQPLSTDLRYNMFGRVQYTGKKCGSCGSK